jgi:hypothetical protein
MMRFVFCSLLLCVAAFGQSSPLEFVGSYTYIQYRTFFTLLGVDTTAEFSTVYFPTNDSYEIHTVLVRAQLPELSSIEAFGVLVTAAGYTDSTAYNHERGSLVVQQQVYLIQDTSQFVFGFDYWGLWTSEVISDSGTAVAFRSPQGADRRNLELLTVDCPECRTFYLALTAPPGNHLRFLSGQMLWDSALSVGSRPGSRSSGMLLCPNPAVNFVRVTLGTNHYTIYDVLGRTVLQGTAVGAVDIAGLSAGKYFFSTGSEIIPFLKVR